MVDHAVRTCLAEQFSPDQFSYCHVHGPYTLPPELKGEAGWEPHDMWQRLWGSSVNYQSHLSEYQLCFAVHCYQLYDAEAFLHGCGILPPSSSHRGHLCRQCEASLRVNASLCYRNVFSALRPWDASRVWMQSLCHRSELVSFCAVKEKCSSSRAHTCKPLH